MVIKEDNQIKQTSQGLISSWTILAIVGTCHPGLSVPTIVRAGANLSRKQLAKFKAFGSYKKRKKTIGGAAKETVPNSRQRGSRMFKLLFLLPAEISLCRAESQRFISVNEQYSNQD